MIQQGDIWHGAGECRFWTDDLTTLQRTPSGIPCCPNGHVGFESPAPSWWEGARDYEANGNPGYVAWLQEIKETCEAPGWEAHKRGSAP